MSAFARAGKATVDDDVPEPTGNVEAGVIDRGGDHVHPGGACHAGVVRRFGS
ncbi:MAG: hypothetical protein R2692_03830 [Microbacterium sp.]